MQTKPATSRPQILTVVLICVSFLLTSTGWLSWEYHLLDQTSARLVDVYTMVVGYGLQALGIGIFALLVYKRPNVTHTLALAALAAHMVCMVPALLSPTLVGALVFGFLMNLACGMVAAYYLFTLASYVPTQHKATSFGLAYAFSILASWLLSLVGGGHIYYSSAVLLVCVVLTLVVAALIYFGFQAASSDIFPAVADNGMYVCASEETSEQDASSGEGVQGSTRATDAAVQFGVFSGPGTKAAMPDKRLLFMVAALVLLFSMVNNSGFAFSTADIGSQVNVEFSRLIYALGLVIAGFVADKNRRYAGICALIALMVPFVLLALRGEAVTVVVFWALAYFTFGFYAIYRIIIFSDLASQYNCAFIAGFGLLFGRAGDALGEALCIVLADNLVALVVITTLLFAVAVAVFFKVYGALYVPEGQKQRSERERFHQFASAHDLSSREQDMLRLLLERKTNGEIAAELFISENTVKFHVRNLLQKTGCKNRSELISSYLDYFA